MEHRERARCIGLQPCGVRSRDGVFFDHAPVYAYFLAACYRIGGVRMLSIAIPQAILSGLIGVMLALAAWYLASRNKGIAAVVASVLILISVRIATFVGYINPARLLLCLSCVAFLVSLLEQQKASKKRVE
ncbi:MAG: glycosyltransferase family 39 protein [Verrucomicrobiia bacterium]